MLVSINHVAAELELSRETVERYIRLGLLPSVQIGRRVLVERKELDAFIAARRRHGRPVEGAPVGGQHQAREPGSTGTLGALRP